MMAVIVKNEHPNRLYYIVGCRLGGEIRYLIWYSDEVDSVAIDGVALDDAGNVQGFGSLSSLHSYMSTQGIALEHENVAMYDLDQVESWLANPQAETIDCGKFLSAWNLFDDILQSVTNQTLEEIYDDDGLNVYDQLFKGANVPSMTPEDARYDPVWTKGDVIVLANYLKRGLNFLKEKIAFSHRDQL